MFTNDSQEISLDEAKQLTATYRANNPNQTLGYAFGKTILLQILNQTNCAGIRVYNGQDANGMQPVIVGVDADGNDLCSGTIGDRSYKSPPYSGSASPLNC